jgi:hypothetical protein
MRQKTEQQLRSLYLKELQETILQQIYETKQKEYFSTIHSLVNLQMTLVPYSSPSFVYEGKVYPDSQTFIKGKTKPLHLSLHNTMNKLLAIDADEQDLFLSLKAVIGNAFLTLRHIQDLPLLLKNDIAAFIPYSVLHTERINIGSPLSPSEITAFHDKNLLHFKGVAKLFLLRILLQEV